MVALKFDRVYFLAAALAEKSPMGLNLQTGPSRGSNVGAEELPGLTRLPGAGSAHFDGYQLLSLILQRHWKRDPVRCPLHFLTSSPVDHSSGFQGRPQEKPPASSPPAFSSSMLHGKHGDVA